MDQKVTFLTGAGQIGEHEQLACTPAEKVLALPLKQEKNKISVCADRYVL